MSRVPAFTLFEVLISLLLVVILGTLAVYTLRGSFHDLTDAEGLSQRQLSVLLACQRIQVDLDQAITLTAATDGGVVLTGHVNEVRYEQHGDTLLRCTATSRDPQLLIRSMELVEVPGAPGLLATWSVQARPENEAGPLVFKKDYDTQTLLRHLIDHGHPHTELP